MKQCIGWKQMNELSDDQLARLLNMEEDLFIWAKEACINQEFTIGKMIEILQDSSLGFNIKKDFDSISERFEGWEVYFYKETAVDTVVESCINKDELCDALWEAVKYLLTGS